VKEKILANQLLFSGMLLSSGSTHECEQIHCCVCWLCEKNAMALAGLEWNVYKYEIEH
jgi:hypothetical protein